MKTKLKDNEVKEIAEMQSKINTYEAFILCVLTMIIKKKEITYPLFTSSNLEQPMNKIWHWINEQIQKRKP